MIRLNDDGKTLVSVGSWEDLLTRPGHMDGVDEKEVKLEEVLGQYRLQPKYPCGLKSCRTPHNNGFLVKLGGGQETHIGKDCGKKHFNHDFTLATNAWKKEENAARYRENIAENQNRVDRWQEAIDELKDGPNGGLMCYREVHKLMARHFDNQTIEALVKRGKRRDGVVSKDVRLSAEERELNVGGGGFRQDRVFTIAGIAATVQYKKLHENRFHELKESLYEFEQIDPDSASHEELKKWDRWVKMMEGRLQKLQELVEECRRFLMPDNIKQIRTNRHLL